MALKFKCDIQTCKKELDEPGAILINPPDKDGRLCLKFHICKECYDYYFEGLIS